MQTTQSWDKTSVKTLFELPLLELIFQAQTIHRQHFNPNEIELCTLLSIKTGACPENCAYCPQSGHFDTGLTKEKLLTIDEVVEKAREAKANGAKRFCMGAAYRNPPEKDFPKIIAIVKAVKALGLETCLTIGMLNKDQAHALKSAELDYYNHNLDTSAAFYPQIITTHTYEDRLDTLENIAKAGIHVCCGGIIGLGETREDHIDFLLQLSQLSKPPESIPINRLHPFKGTPLEHQQKPDDFEFIRVIAVTRIMMPTSKIRLSAGRLEMSEEMQALGFMAGANSIHFGEKLLTSTNSDQDKDLQMLAKLGLTPAVANKDGAQCAH